MEVIIQKFIEDIQHFSIAELRTLCIELKRENEKLNSVLSAYRASDTDLARDYQTAQSTISDLRQQLNKLQNNYNHIAAQNDLLNRHRFGSHNEKLDNLCSHINDDLLDPLSEDYDPEAEETGTDSNPARPLKKKEAAPQASENNEDRAARTETRKMVHDILGDGRSKTTSTKMDLSRLPRKVNYILDIEKNDQLYGKDNWEIVSWRNTEQLHRPLYRHRDR